MTESPFRSRTTALLVLAAVCVLAYAPSLFLPLIEDDYPILNEAQRYGSPGGAGALFATPVFRFRATSYWTINALWQVFHLNPPAFHAASLALHVVNTWLVFWLALAWPRMRPAAFWAAAFFGVHEGHQEAVMWFTAINELLQFAFGVGALVCWKTRRPVAGVALFALAMVSKESAVILPAFFLLTLEPEEWRGAVRGLLPYGALASVAVISIAAARASSFRFADGSFSLHAPFWITWPRGMARLLWPWGAIALAVVARGAMRTAAVALVWIGMALVPYSFLTYSTQIPSRQTYLAGVGVALLVGMALARVERRRLAAAVAVLVLLANVGYLWTKKRTQFLERAKPTEDLIRLARSTTGPIYIRCFPRNRYIAEEAVHVGAGRPASAVVWTAEEAAKRQATAEFCE